MTQDNKYATEEEYKKDLKIQALLEKLSSTVTNYEDQIANLRVELTVRDEKNKERIQALINEVERLSPKDQASPAAYGKVVEGEVIEDTTEEEG